MGTVPELIRIREVLDVQPFRITCRWSNGEIRVNDFTEDVARWQKSKNPYIIKLAEPAIFGTAFAPSGTLAFAGVLVDVEGMEPQPLDLDPDVLFDESTLVVAPYNQIAS